MLHRAPLAILLDLGGVLIDVSFERSLRYWRACAQMPDQRSPPLVSHDRHLAADMFTDSAIVRAYEHHERAQIDFVEFAAILEAKLRLNLSECQWRQGWNAALGDPLPGAVELVHRVAERWPVFLFSNTNATHHAHWSAQQQTLLTPMRCVFVSNELGLRKPDPLSFEAVATRIGVDADRITFFDDRQDNIDGARQAGLHAWRADSPAQVAHKLGIELPSS